MTQNFALHRLEKPSRPDSFGLAETPLGHLLFAWQDTHLVRVQVLPAGAEADLAGIFHDLGWEQPLKRDDKRATTLKAQIFPSGQWSGRFDGKLDLAFYGTDTQWAMQQTLFAVKPGQTITYKAMAEKSGAKNAARAAGSVCARNPLPLIVPCHRILASDGSLGGFAYGLPMKAQLLAWEKKKQAA